ncbi:cytochrome c biogenesis protein ResB [Actinacidiphila acididurans]|uniref:Cytochrome c biogenesis protein ResB n=1 Tax=Actinacidiphila acididurans TaxID=2784346 RepID=A0ABS2TSF3_9ACTN|nr:cytochrome c biogenesis protein ResB [Actinacidiphila acididurans]MBM9504908.1 cytochrome c biogenesis protein ResB [Actinacidiphila acididurans]
MSITHKTGDARAGSDGPPEEGQQAQDVRGAQRDQNSPEPGEDGPDGLGAAGAQLSTAPVESLSAMPALGVLGWLRWMWRQLTSMRIALILLFLLSLAAIPGSLIPQHSDQLKVDTFKKAHPTISPLYERLGMFHVYSSPWFSAIYILLFVSLAGCIVPRTWQFVGQLRSRPPAAPRNLTRLPAYTTWRTEATPEEVTRAAERVLKGRRFRISTGGGTGGTGGTAVAAEKGYLREAGNLLFHVALFGLLIAFAVTSLNNAQGGKLIVQGSDFVNNLTEYDDFTSSTLYNGDDLKPFGFHLDNFEARYATSGPEKGTALKFQADIHYWNGPDGKQVKGAISENHPLSIGGEKVYLISHGYAPQVTVKDGQGNVAYQGPVPFLPQDTNITSTGVVKVPDALGKDGKPDQLGFSGIFTPTGDPSRGPISVFPQDLQPLLFLTAYHGDLGLDSGIAQNVYQLDTQHMKQFQFNTKTGVKGVVLRPGEKMTLPDGAGSLTFNGVTPWASFTVSHQSGDATALVSGALAILGLALSLFVQRRRIWVRALPADGGGTLVEMGGLGRSESARIADELGDVAVQILPDAPVRPDDPDVPEAVPEDVPEAVSEDVPEPEEPPLSDDAPHDEGARA